MDAVAGIQDAVDRLPGLGSLDLVIDVEDLTYIGSAGLAELIRLKAACATVVLRGTPHQLRRLLEVTGLDDTFAAREPEHA